MVKKIDAWIGRLPRPVTFSIGILLLLLLSIVDYSTHILIAFDDFYLIPIALITWYGSFGLGMLCTLLATVAWYTGCMVPEQMSSQPAIIVWNILGQFAFFAVFSLLLAMLKKRLAAMESLASRDPLTQIANRRAFYRAAEMEANRARRYGTVFTIAYLDIDDFKLVNDMHGHGIGDSLLMCVAQVLRAFTRVTDIVGRIGGDEFVILLPETDEAQARKTIEKLRRALIDQTASKVHPATFSIGVVTFVKPPPSIDAMLKYVDEMMYSVKLGSKNSVHYGMWPEAPALPDPLRADPAPVPQEREALVGASKE
jgi:diguanylate cyclase (GGDEF)-like protein